MTELVIASTNPGKIQEIDALLHHLPITLINPKKLGLILEISEENDSYLNNARRKAQAYVERTGCWTLADDTGLEVDVLDGAPGLQSARLAGPGRSDFDRRILLLSLLHSHPRPWLARFRCAMVLAGSAGSIDSAEGICEGEIIPQERGDHGFGYDPIFLLAGVNKTMAELTLEEKNHLSHRARAIQAILPVLKERLGFP
ncbi:MAG: non-canonical purine NTP pyrophosphatase, RdgB/HAM1 family [Chloroflexi bacterium RBG_16_48_8]|nr:MAG: non-canonical purine NTP pyrophosphatase, RdgB/HAM1 family [Chloroflexi bacterium RBG_16_48_8]